MANANAQTHDIDLASPNLNLDKYKLGVSQFDGFNYRNSPFISHEIKNLYTKDVSKSNSDWFDTNNDRGDKYYISNDNKTLIKKDGHTGTETIIHSFTNTVSMHQSDVRILFISNTWKVYVEDNTVKIQFLIKIDDELLDPALLGNTRTGNDEYYIVENNNASQWSLYTLAIFCIKSDKKTLYADFVCVDTHQYIIPDTNITVTSVSPTLITAGQIADVVCGAAYENYIDTTHYTNPTNRLIVESTFLFGINIKINTTNNSDSSYRLGYLQSFRQRQVWTGEHTSSNTYTYNTILNIYSTIDSNPLVDYVAFAANNYYMIFACTPIKNTNQICHWGYLNKDCFNSFSSSSGTNFVKENYIKKPNSITNNNISIRFYDKCKAITYGEYTGDNGVHTPYYIYSVNNKLHYTYIPSWFGGDTAIPEPIKYGFYDDIFEAIYYGQTKIKLVIYNGVVANIVVSRDNTGCVALFPWFYIDKLNGIELKQDENKVNIYYEKNRQSYYATINLAGTSLDFEVFRNRYLLFNSIEYLNCYDVVDNKFMHYSDGVISIPISDEILGNCQTAIGEQRNSLTDVICYGACAAAYSAAYEADKNVFPGIQTLPFISFYPQTLINYITTDIIPKDIVFSNAKTYGYYFYLDDNQNGDSLVALYSSTLSPNGSILAGLEIGDAYPIDQNGNMLLPIPIATTFDENDISIIAKINKYISMQQVTIPRQGGTVYAIYYILQAQEEFDMLFAIQNQLFAISNNDIYSVSLQNNIFVWGKVICSCKNLVFLCSTPISAFFWSPLNNTIYQFQGDNLFHRGQTIDEIDKIYVVRYNVATNDIVMCCDNYTIILSEQYAYKIENYKQGNISYPYKDVFFGKSFIGLRNDVVTTFISYRSDINNVSSGYSKQKIIVKTQLYGLDNNMLSETDCVYIRVFNAENETGSQSVKVSGFTLTDTKRDLIEREYVINQSDWDEKKTYYIRYQPTFQKALGIQIDIESTVPITYIGVSNIPDTKMITKI